MFEHASSLPGSLNHISLPIYARGVGKRGVNEIINGKSSCLISDSIEINFCIQGTGTAYIFDHPFPMKENDVVFYYPNEDHGFVSDSEESAIAWVIFDGPLAMSLFSCYHFPRHFSLDRPFPENLYKELLWCLPKSDPASILHASTQIFLLFEYLAGGGIKSLSYSEFSVESAARYIESNLSNPELNVNTICEALHISRASFRKKFMEKMYITPKRYIQNQRIAKARALLAGTALSIQEIGRQCGFLEKSSFSRFFREYPNSMSPREYRRIYNRTGIVPEDEME